MNQKIPKYSIPCLGVDPKERTKNVYKTMDIHGNTIYHLINNSEVLT